MKTIKSIIIPIPRQDIDTDLIIPAQFLTCTTKAGLGTHLFSRVKTMDPSFPLNQAKYRPAKILVTRENFGCGSSREHAAWALADWGIQVVIAPSFADIFFNNAMKNGILPVVLPAAVLEAIFREEARGANYTVEVDLERQQVILPCGKSHAFTIDPYRKECLIKGIDDLEYLIAHKSNIGAYDRERKTVRFVTVCK